MSRLREMIQELCPDGVEYRKLGEILSRHKGIAITAGRMKELHTPDGEIRIFAAGNTYADVMESDVDRGGIIREPAIIVKSRGNIGFEYYTKPFSHKNEMWSYTKNHAFISLKYVYYVLEQNMAYFQNKAKTGKLPQISISDTENYEIPVPPLAIQNEIVKLLDNFTGLTAELTAELQLRKKQYSFYRDSLLNFSQDNTEVEWKTLGEIATDIFRGAGIRRDEVTEDGIPCVRYGEIYTKYGIWFDSCFSHTNEAVHSVPKYFEHGDILFAITGENIDEIAKSTAYIGNEKCLAGGDIVVLKHEQNPKYLSYVLSTEMAQKQKSRGKVKSKVVHSSVPAIKDIKIPIPPLEMQAKIVSILDRFDALCHDLTQGLPAEIAARKKQYEYYRDKLLTFPRKGESGGSAR